MSKLIRSTWVWTLMLLLVEVLLVSGASGVATPSTYNYDRPSSYTLSLDIVYDASLALPTSENEIKQPGNRPSLANFAQFLAAETTALRNPNVYEALYEAPITGTTRSAQRASANNFLANQLQNDAQLNGMLNQELGGNVLQHMESGSGSSFLNPPGTVWHHPFDDPTVMQLLRTGEHTAPSLQPVLHPGGVGGFGNFYAP